MDNVNNIFIQEARELIITLEEALLALEGNPKNNEQIQEVFRVMHTLKGGSSMFGFQKIEELTHNLETIYDLIREGKASVTTKVLDVTLKTVDHFSALLIDSECQQPQNIDNHRLIIQIIQEALAEINITPISGLENDRPSSPNTLHTFLIHISFDQKILSNGTNPLFLIEDLLEIGNGSAFAHTQDIPSFSKLEFDKCYVQWDVVLATKNTKNEIKDVFIFVEDECTIDIKEICPFDLLELDDLKSLTDTPKIDFEASIMEIASNYSQPEEADNLVDLNSDLSSKIAKSSSIRVSTDKLDELMNLVSELVTTQAGLGLYSEIINDDRLDIISENIEMLSRQLRDTAYSMTLVPLNNVFYRFQRLVRDLSTQLNKKVKFTTKGGETELDKTIIEALADPIMHLLRNSLDHGLETSEERKKAGKDETGTISLEAFYSGANVHIQVRDNGKGIDPIKIKAKAIEKGLITANAILTDQEVLNLIFEPGFSTASEITGVSGRGVGMDVVQRNITELRGEVNLISEEGEGTIVEIILPLTLSVVDGMLVKIDDTHFVIPLAAVDKCFETSHQVLEDNFNNIVVIDEEQVPYCYLRKEFDIHQNCPEIEQIIVVNSNDSITGIVVDEIIGEYQAVLKPLGRFYKNVKVISGATILGDGTIALVLDTNRLVQDNARSYSSHTHLKEEDASLKIE